MNLQQRLDQDIKEAMRSKAELKLSVLRSLKSALTYAAVDAKAKGGEGVFTDEQVQAVFAREAKKRQDSADAFTQGGATERADQELAEKAIISEYLPEPVSEDELNNLIETAIAELGADDMQSMGKVIGVVRNKAGGSIDGARLAQLVKERLSK